MSEADAPVIAGVRIIEEGDVPLGGGYVAMAEKAVKELALKLVEGQAFASWMISEHDSHLMGSIFMPAFLTDDIGRKRMEAAGIVHLYGLMTDTFPRSINGYPCFHKTGWLTREDAQRVHAAALRVIEFRKEFMGDNEDKGEKD